MLPLLSSLHLSYLTFQPQCCPLSPPSIYPTLHSSPSAAPSLLPPSTLPYIPAPVLPPLSSLHLPYLTFQPQCYTLSPPSIYPTLHSSPSATPSLPPPSILPYIPAPVLPPLSSLHLPYLTFQPQCYPLSPPSIYPTLHSSPSATPSLPPPSILPYIPATALHPLSPLHLSYLTFQPQCCPLSPPSIYPTLHSSHSAPPSLLPPSTLPYIPAPVLPPLSSLHLPYLTFQPQCYPLSPPSIYPTLHSSHSAPPSLLPPSTLPYIPAPVLPPLSSLHLPYLTFQPQCSSLSPPSIYPTLHSSPSATPSLPPPSILPYIPAPMLPPLLSLHLPYLTFQPQCYPLSHLSIYVALHSSRNGTASLLPPSTLPYILARMVLPLSSLHLPYLPSHTRLP